MHAGSIRTSELLRKTFNFIWYHSQFISREDLSLNTYCTSEMIRRETKSVAVHSDVAALRAAPNNYDILCKYLRLSREGRRVFGYCLAGKKDKVDK